jgi:polar amino acid transport system substrate-binding protein
MLKLFQMIFWLSLFLTNSVLAKDLHASLGQLPKLIESAEKGEFVDLVKAFGEVYKDGKIQIKVYPFARSVDNATTGKADFHIPMLRHPFLSEEKLPYRYASMKLGDVYFVIYSHKDNPITKEKLDQAKKQTPFPLKIETNEGIREYFDFPNISSNSLEQSIKKIETRRADALVWAQEEADHVVKTLNAQQIHRSYYGVFDDVIVIPKGAKGDETDKILTKIIKDLQASGRLAELHKKVHVPYVDWQPYLSK